MTERVFVRDLMTVGVTTCAPETPIVELARLLLAGELEAVAVLDHEGFAVGMVSQTELARAYAQDDWRQLTAEAIMHSPIPQIPPDIPLKAAAQIMCDQGVRIVFLMHHAGGIAYPAAALTFNHLLRHLAARDDSELNDLGIKAARQPPLDTFIARRDAARRQSSFSNHEE